MLQQASTCILYSTSFTLSGNFLTCNLSTETKDAVAIRRCTRVRCKQDLLAISWRRRRPRLLQTGDVHYFAQKMLATYKGDISARVLRTSPSLIWCTRHLSTCVMHETLQYLCDAQDIWVLVWCTRHFRICMLHKTLQYLCAVEEYEEIHDLLADLMSRKVSKAYHFLFGQKVMMRSCLLIITVQSQKKAECLRNAEGPMVQHRVKRILSTCGLQKDIEYSTD